jgi:hypothetical protein
MNGYTLKAQTERSLLAMALDIASGRNVDRQVIALAKQYGIELAN